MPRLATALLRKARALDPLLPPLLAPCRDLGAAQNELRWLREHVTQTAKSRNTKEKAALLKQLVQDRASGKPLQYILGSEYFGDLEIQCRPGVLIPRYATTPLAGWDRS
jgi:methylase of polypeptide subunit release factors